MATGEIVFGPQPNAGYDPSAPAGMLVENGVTYPAFDDTTPEGILLAFPCPADFASGPILDLYYSAVGTSGKVEFEVSVWSNADGETAATTSFDTANTGTAPTVPGTTRLQDTYSITLTNNDSMAAGEWIVIQIFRDADDATNDTVTGDVYFLGAKFKYTTT